MSNPSFISFSGVSKSYDGAHYVVDDLNLDVRKGEFLSLLGPSGSGKTTTLMMLAGFETPTQGEIRLDGRRLDDKPPHQRDIGMVFQNYALFPHLTIAENVAFPLSVRRVSRAEQKTRVKRALEMIELPHLANRRPSQLSGGQQQRVALARALVFEPSVVLMDEPLGALDKRLRETMQYEIMRLHRELSLTIVYVTHDQAEALTMSNRVAVFSDGRIQQAATPSELYENAQNAFVANFVGENNGLTGRVVNVSGDSATLALADGSIIRGRCESGLREGDDAMLALRPERAHIPSAEGTHADGHSNVVQARVEELVYCGDHHRVHLKLGARDAIVVKVPNTQRHALPAPGNMVEVAWRHDDCKILAMTASAHRNAPANYSPPSPLPTIITTAPAGAN
ncbi:ABC transporter ATP-binding protein [Paraburkholderia hospita]|jgi:putative spermidine/putrescine transport system ATP-binding protein|uniref:ABC transporter ATP-binding protein n=1 Tax=Paraburkholderia TaxID=1822464 RepID=UPI00027193B2|nr:ABC transporter ATP-binding protein [Paraburkholderia hospita]EUC11849.1 spermidine/putrescine ABC transporter ATPase subunit [Burkholderia sp. BT03]SOE89697.1 spermidine/putrescine ABC transporter ATP-binding subunit [Burkholderia sp. YR290]OUL68138.1 Fe3+/spermidine/putrescine ABC transporter ATP-binding protein [Paraburkholderia hospita]SKC98562.1 spermidine/putrescine ABC transporter ATP-binding subunit [Paraburkholderia hospita]SKD07393.1 spermidine/putrescine ABC transporter ATP-bindi